MSALHCRCLFTHTKKKNQRGQSANSSAKPLPKDRQARWGGGCWCMWLSAIQLLSKLQKKHFETRCKWTVELLKWTQATQHTTGILKVIFIFLLFSSVIVSLGSFHMLKPFKSHQIIRLFLNWQLAKEILVKLSDYTPDLFFLDL